MLGKHFAFVEVRSNGGLKPSQLECGRMPDCYTCTEHGSKNHQGGFGTSQHSNKVVTIYANSDAEPRDLVYLVDFYFSKFPKPPNLLDFFYLKPLAKVPVNFDDPWFEATPIGKNTLGKFVRNMCEEAKIEEKKVNHSLRATGTSALFNAEVPEKLIKGVTGHKSSTALHLYERPTAIQQRAVSKVLTAPATGQGSMYRDHLQNFQQSIPRRMLPIS